MNLASTVVRCAPKRRRRRAASWVLNLVTLLALSLVLALVLHVGRHFHAALLKAELRRTMRQEAVLACLDGPVFQGSPARLPKTSASPENSRERCASGES